MRIPLSKRRSYFPIPLEWIAVALARLLYRVRFSGTEKFPAQGGALLVANHLSYVDVIVLQLACPRPIRYVGFQGLQHNALFRLAFRWSGVIPISSQRPTEAVRQVVKALAAGDVVCVFPEGHISRTGQLMEIKRGFEVMARQGNVPVVAAAIDGLWGSVFSFAGNRYLWKSPRLLPTPVFVAFGAPIPPREATPAVVRQALLDLGAAAFAERPVLKRHVGRECVRMLARNPGRVQVVDYTGARREVKSAQLLAVAAVLAKRIRATIPEPRVGIALPPGAGGFIANLAVACAGKVPVNLNFTAGRAAVEASLKIAGIRTVITANAMRAKVPQFPWPERTVDLAAEIEAAGGKRAIVPWLIAAWILPNQWIANLLRLPKIGDRGEAGVLFTSGSSGEPKGVVLTHRNVLANCAQVSSLSILPQSCTLLGCLPLFHSMGFTITLWYPLLRGCRVVTVPSPLDTRRILDAISGDGVTVFLAAPTFLRPMLKRAKPGELKSLEVVVTGAEKLPEDLYDAFLELFHIELLQGYGLTETSPATNLNQPDPPVTTATAEPQHGKKTGTTGRLFPGMTALIVNPETGAPLPTGETGMLLFRGENVFGGYLDDPEKTRAAFRDGWFVTGDLAHFDSEGFLVIEGRLSRFSKIGGEMVPHGTVEQKIISAFGWEQAERAVVAVAGVPDASKGEAIVVLSTEPITSDELRTRLLAAGLPNLWVPKRVFRVEQIPVLGTGKLDLKGIRETALKLSAGPAE